MKNLKIATILLFAVAAIIPAISMRVTALTKSTAKADAVESADKATSNPAPQDTSKFVGSDRCAECHTNQASHIAITAHRKTNFKGAQVDMVGCEACHGGARDHLGYYAAAQKLIADGKDAEAQALYADQAKADAAKMLSFDSLSVAASSAICLKCHEGSQGRSEERFNFRRSEHFRHGVACIDCHSSHSPKRTEFLLKDNEPEGCYKCHQDQKATFARPFHHKVPEGGIKCSDCHNQHGGFQSKQLRSWAGGDNSCLKCHTDKAGPFAYEHAPIKVEGCQACHTPHGSTNPKLLKRNEVRFLCLECHSNTPGLPEEGSGVGPPTPSFHDITQPRIQNCTACHLTIHGSNADPYFRR